MLGRPTLAASPRGRVPSPWIRFIDTTSSAAILSILVGIAMAGHSLLQLTCSISESGCRGAQLRHRAKRYVMRYNVSFEL